MEMPIPGFQEILGEEPNERTPPKLILLDVEAVVARLYVIQVVTDYDSFHDHW